MYKPQNLQCHIKVKFNNYTPPQKKIKNKKLVWQFKEARSLPGKTTTTQTAPQIKMGAGHERFWFGSAAGEAESWEMELSPRHAAAPNLTLHYREQQGARRRKKSNPSP